MNTPSYHTLKTLSRRSILFINSLASAASDALRNDIEGGANSCSADAYHHQQVIAANAVHLQRLMTFFDGIRSKLNAAGRRRKLRDLMVLCDTVGISFYDVVLLPSGCQLIKLSIPMDEPNDQLLYALDQNISEWTVQTNALYRLSA